eukprot:scaffold8093_cov174-Skeletonema_marinoi.AAC.2
MRRRLHIYSWRRPREVLSIITSVSIFTFRLRPVPGLVRYPAQKGVEKATPDHPLLADHIESIFHFLLRSIGNIQDSSTVCFVA